MTFSEQIKRFQTEVQFKTHEVFVNTSSAAHNSVQNGSPVTGAPGQLVDTGNLKSSWQLSFPDANTAEITTNVIYARMAEDGVTDSGTPVTQRSEVGGFHSVALTVAGIQALADSEALKLK